jgi:DnaJ homolog subfamily C member 13
LQELIAEWRKEMAREAADFSKNDALKAMAMEPTAIEGADADAFIVELKKSYKRQALRLHPDKCPDGPQPFLRMQAAYRLLLALAQGEAEEGGGPRSHRLLLLLQAQCLLYTRFPDIVGEYTYPAYDTLLTLLHSALEDGGVLHEFVRPCMELTWLTLNACPDNAPFLGDKGAVPVFVSVLARSLEDAKEDTPSTAPKMVVAALTLRALAVVLWSRDARSMVLDLPEGNRGAFLANLLRCSRLERATNVAAAALDVIASAVASLEIQQELVRRGLLGHLFARMLRYAPPSSRIGRCP